MAESHRMYQTIAQDSFESSIIEPDVIEYNQREIPFYKSWKLVSLILAFFLLVATGTAVYALISSQSVTTGQFRILFFSDFYQVEGVPLFPGFFLVHLRDFLCFQTFITYHQVIRKSLLVECLVLQQL